MSGNLHRRLTALEAIAEQCRVRECRDIIRAELVRRYAADGMTLQPHVIEPKIDRALALAETMVLLAAGGLTLDEIAVRMAVEHDLDPQRVLAAFHDVRARYGR